MTTQTFDHPAAIPSLRLVWRAECPRGEISSQLNPVPRHSTPSPGGRDRNLLGHRALSSPQEAARHQPIELLEIVSSRDGDNETGYSSTPIGMCSPIEPRHYAKPKKQMLDTFGKLK